MKTVVVLPTKNEADSVEEMILRIRDLNLPFFIVDENSTDGTVEKAKKLGAEIFQRTCLGKGCGVISAFEIAQKKGFDAIALIDCDSTYPVELIPSMIKMLDEFDMVVGARPMNSITFVHRIGNMINTIAINILFFTKLKDINSGLRIMRVKDFVGKLNAHGFDIEAEITAKALKQKLRVKEIPIDYKERVGVSKILWVDGFKILWRIIKERFS